MLVSNHGYDFKSNEFTRMISDQIALHSVQLPLFINFLRDPNRAILPFFSVSLEAS